MPVSVCVDGFSSRTDSSSLIPPHSLVGIDEAGRGPLAGPVAVGAVAFLKPFDRAVLKDANDSKKLSEKKREEVRHTIESLAADGVLAFSVAFSSSRMIDEKGIVPAIQDALSRALMSLPIDPRSATVELDGSLKAPGLYVNQKTIIRGDATHLSIMLASIMAKTERDREMVRLSIEFPVYGFEQHKGYGTKAHYEAIKKHGLCLQHRITFVT